MTKSLGKDFELFNLHNENRDQPNPTPPRNPALEIRKREISLGHMEGKGDGEVKKWA